MRELAVEQRQIRDEEGNLRVYEYTVLVGELAIAPGIFCESYGVKVCERGGECGEVRDITVSLTRLDELMELLIRNVVTPCTLRDVIDDWL